MRTFLGVLVVVSLAPAAGLAKNGPLISLSHEYSPMRRQIARKFSSRALSAYDEAAHQELQRGGKTEETTHDLSGKTLQTIQGSSSALLKGPNTDLRHENVTIVNLLGKRQLATSETSKLTEERNGKALSDTTRYDFRQERSILGKLLAVRGHTQIDVSHEDGKQKNATVTHNRKWLTVGGLKVVPLGKNMKPEEVRTTTPPSRTVASSLRQLTAGKVPGAPVTKV